MHSETAPRSTVRSFIERYRSEILADWQRAARKTIGAARELGAVALADHIPELLDQIAEIAEAVVAERAPPSFETARRHAIDRIGEGFDVAAVVRELSLLRGCMLAIVDRETVALPLGELRALNLAIDHAIAVSVKRFAASRESALAKLESLLAASPVGIAFLDRELRYLRINDALAELNGRAAADHIGRTVADIIPGAADHAVPMLQQVLSTGMPILNLEVALPHPVTGETLSLIANYFPVRAVSGEITGVGGVVVDVTALARTQAALRTEQARFQAVIDHSPAAIWVKDQAGRIIIANRPLAEAIGVPQAALIGKRSDELLPGTIAHDDQQHDHRVLAEGGAIEVEEIAPSPSGDRTFLSIKFPIPGDPPMVGGIAAEITERKRMEHELELAVRTREDLLSVVSHDLRSPLSTVQLSSTILLGHYGGDARARRHLDLIIRACTRIESLIDDLLDTSLIREGRFQLDSHRERIDEVARETIELQQPLAAEKGLAIAYDSDIEGTHVMCDRDRILQVFANLVGNAIKFCRAGDTLRITARRDGACVRFCVEDSGPGIPAEALAHLFEPYWSRPEHATQGAGLGLYIVRGIIESHGGRVWAESEPGRGARFMFTLPISE